MPRWMYKGKMISGSHSRASEISYNGNGSGLNSGNVQDAIDEHVLNTDSKIGDMRSLTTISKGSLVEAVNEQSEKLNENKAICSDEYDPGKSYHIGEYCIHDNKMQKCKTSTAGTTEVPEEFDQTKWDVVTIAGELSEQNEKMEWTKVSFVGAVDAPSIPSNKSVKVPSTAEEICVEITVKRRENATIKFSQHIKTSGFYIGGYYNSDKYYASYAIGYSNNVIYLSKSWLKVVDDGTAYDNIDTAQVDVYYR